MCCHIQYNQYTNTHTHIYSHTANSDALCIYFAESPYPVSLGAKSPLWPLSYTHTGRCGPRALGCGKQVNIERTGFIRIEKGLQQSILNKRDWACVFPPQLRDTRLFQAIPSSAMAFSIQTDQTTAIVLSLVLSHMVHVWDYISVRVCLMISCMEKGCLHHVFCV